MEDVRKWMESRLGSVPGLLAIIVTDRQIIVHNFSNLCISFSSELLCSREGVPVVRASTAECPETAVRSPAFCQCLIKKKIFLSMAAVLHSQAHIFGWGFQRKLGRAGEQVGCWLLSWYGGCLSNSPGYLLFLNTRYFLLCSLPFAVFISKPPACPLSL